MMKGYKGFKKDFKCQGMQYEVGKEFSVDGELKICENGLHFCKYPLDVFGYYGPSVSRFAEVEALGEVKSEDSNNFIEKDSKMCTNKLKVCTEIGVPDLVDAAVDYIKDKAYYTNKTQETIVESQNTSGYGIAVNRHKFSIAINKSLYSAAINTGDRSLATNIGAYSTAINTGDFGIATSAGVRSIASSTGDSSSAINESEHSAAINVGYDSVAINMGEHSVAATTGRAGMAINEGYQSLATTIGYGSAAVATRKGSIAISFGCKGVAKGPLGSWIVLSEWVCGNKVGKDVCVVKDVKCFKVDGKDILPDTFYKLVDGKPVIAKEEE